MDTIDTSLGNLQTRTIGTESFVTFPVIITGNLVAVYPHLDLLSSTRHIMSRWIPAPSRTPTPRSLSGITSTNGWEFTTKPTGPANPNNLVVAADNSGDFATVQGAVDSLPTNNTTPTLVNIRNSTYTRNRRHAE